MKIRSAIQPTLNSPQAQAIIQRVTSEETKRDAIDHLYQLLPAPARWGIKKAAFATFVRINNFRERFESLSASKAREKHAFDPSVSADDQQAWRPKNLRE